MLTALYQNTYFFGERAEDLSCIRAAAALRAFDIMMPYIDSANLEVGGVCVTVFGI